MRPDYASAPCRMDRKRSRVRRPWSLSPPDVVNGPARPTGPNSIAISAGGPSFPIRYRLFSVIPGSGGSSSPSILMTTSCSGRPLRVRRRAVTAIHGGATRQESTRLALRALRDDAPNMVLIHDGVRPFVDPGLIDRTIDAIDERQRAAGDAGGRHAETHERRRQCRRDGAAPPARRPDPQGFPFWPILAAHERRSSSASRISPTTRPSPNGRRSPSASSPARRTT